MADLFSIELPKTVSRDDLVTLKGEIKQLDGVAGAGLEDTRGIDPETLGVWVQLAKDALSVVGIAVPIIQQIIKMIRDKGIKGVKIILDENVSISADEASAKDIESMLRAVRQ